MPAFSDFVKSQDIGYKFSKFVHFKNDKARSMSMPPRRQALTPDEIGEAIKTQLGGLGLGLEESVSGHVNAAVEEVNDILDIQKEKSKFLECACKLRRAVKRRKTIANPTQDFLNALGHLDNVERNIKNKQDAP